MDEPPQTPAFGETELRLIEAAERLFAQSGVADVSIRSLIAAAGQRNQRAVVYHFGSLDGVVEALIRLRRHELNARELDALRALGPAGRPAGSREGAEQALGRHVRALLEATREVATTTDWGPSFVKMYPALLLRLAPASRSALPATLWSAHEAVLEAYAVVMPELPEAVRRQRFGLAVAMAANASSQWAAGLADPPSATDRRRARAAFDEIARMIASSLCAPSDDAPAAARGPRRAGRGDPA